MARFVLARLLRAFLTVWLVVTLVFVGIRLSGDPARMALGDNATPVQLAQYRHAMGLDASIATQYRRYFSTLLHGDFGRSIVDPRPVTTIVGRLLPATLELMSIAIGLTIAVGVPVGLLAATRRNSLFDRATITLALVGQAMPAFLIGILLIFAFSIGVTWLPSSGRGGVAHLAMPVVTITLGGLATIARITRAAVVEALHEDFVRTARAKGLHERQVMVFHVLRNAAIPIITIAGFLVSGTVAGSVVVETVFAWPGMGRLVATSVSARDYPVLQFAVIVITVAVVTINFLVDVAYSLLDPRIRVRTAGRTG